VLKSEECKQIVERVYNIVDKNINIINLQGIVVASSNPKRIGTFHEGGRLAATSDVEVIITEQNKHLYKGCKEGINLPIKYKKKTIGIVGITGDPKEIKPYGLIVKELVELLIQENESRYNRELQDQAIVNFILELIKSPGVKDEETYERRAKFLNVGDLRNKIIAVGSINYLSKELQQSGEIKIQEAKSKLLEFVKSYYKDEKIIIFYLYDGSFIMILPYKDNLKEDIIELRQQIIKELKIDVSFVISEECKTYSDYGKNYSKLDRAVIINNSQENRKDIISVKNYSIELLMDSISYGYKEQYLENYDDFFSQSKNKLKQELIETVKVYFENNMNIGSTSEALFVHRNTIGYRINKIKEEFGIDITKAYECMKLYIAICLREQPMH